MVNHLQTLSVLAVLGASPALHAADLIVDPNGAPGTYRTIQAAMDAARVGDRILVRPGRYPGFAVTKSVSILGLGSGPGAVRASGVAFHPVFPQAGYRVEISRMTLEGDADSALALSGNELGSGELDLESVVLEGGVVLGVGQAGGFRVGFENCDVRSELAREGFHGATATVDGPDVFVELDRTEISGASGTQFPFRLPLAGLSVGEGARLRIAQSVLTGGVGAPGQAGAPALVVRDARVPAIHAGAIVVGGRGGAGAPGGAAVRSDGSVFVGDAIVRGGVGTPGGPPIEGRGSILRLDPNEPALTLSIDGDFVGPRSAIPGSRVRWVMHTPSGAGVVATATSLAVRPLPQFPDLMLDPAAELVVVHFGGEVTVPNLPADLVGLFLHSQGIVLEPARAPRRATTPVTVRIDGQ